MSQNFHRYITYGITNYLHSQKLVKTHIVLIIWPILSYSTVVLYIGIVKVWDSSPKISPKNQLDIYFVTSRQDWLGIAKPKNVFRSTKNLIWFFFKILTDWLMPSDKHNSIRLYLQPWFLFTVQRTSLHPGMCLFANRSSSSAHIMVLPKLTFALLCTPFLSSLARRWQFAVRVLLLRCETRVTTELAGVLLKLFFAWKVT